MQSWIRLTGLVAPVSRLLKSPVTKILVRPTKLRTTHRETVVAYKVAEDLVRSDVRVRTEGLYAEEGLVQPLTPERGPPPGPGTPTEVPTLLLPHHCQCLGMDGPILGTGSS